MAPSARSPAGRRALHALAGAAIIATAAWSASEALSRPAQVRVGARAPVSTAERSKPPRLATANRRPTAAAKPASRRTTAGAGRGGPRSAAPVQVAEPAEARLIEVYRLAGRGDTRQALGAAERLVADQPHFQLAQLIYADLLAARLSPARLMPPEVVAARRTPGPVLEALRQESRRRLQRLTEAPPAGTVPSQFLALAPRARYAIAVDTSRSRLYLLENTAGGLKLANDYYISVGRLGVDKTDEGDARTPLGVYYVTSNLNPKSLRDFYGAGALPLNYPNAYDLRRGRSGSGIWLHGTPPDSFSRPPQDSDGCVVMANVDLRDLLSRVDVGATPVVIAENLQWVAQATAAAQRRAFEQVLAAWRDARAAGDLARVQAYYLPDAQRVRRRAAPRPVDWQAEAQADMGRHADLKELSLLRWQNGEDDTMVASFGEVVAGAMTGRKRRQYWLHQADGWKLFQDDISS